MSERCVIRVKIVNRLGLHARPAMCFVDAASAFPCTVMVTRVGASASGAGTAAAVDGKSIMQMMMLAATKGTELEIAAEGPQAQSACEALKKLVEGGFDEE